MNDIKTTRIEIRLTEKEKQWIKNYAINHNTTVSKLFREFLQQIMQGEQIRHEQK